MIANYVNEQHDTWDQFLREFAYAIRTAVNETTGNTPAKLFLRRKLITPFQKLVMLSDGTEFVVGDIERLFEESRRNTKAKHEKGEKYYYSRRRDVQIKNIRCKEEQRTHTGAWKAGKRLAVDVDQVRIYRHRKCDETEIGTGSSDNGSLRDESSGFDRVQRRSNVNLGGRTGTILRPSSVPLKSKNQEINRLELAVKLPWAIFFKSVVEFGVSFSYMFSHSKIKNEMKGKKEEEMK
ncbi:uncharacterized protein TNCV_241481 [Trichonephila clavipes]|uniref:Uncharacterized protein n=1 Tax=Trichonephila clavipes TaxID=2585209 RepID=A0A8X6W3K7_TRICX|nr:uncharacterized protein TNCV_241481 [Trichonephila clavipes]